MSNRSSGAGILLVDKPAGLTSAEVLNEIKAAHSLNRIGHGGTLDPFATGLLVVLVGDATKIARFLLEGEKLYEATAQLGCETDTGDPTGKIVKSAKVPALDASEWQEIAASFTGRIRQTPPIYSAVKVKGKALHEYAREGREVEVKSREVQIKELQILSMEQDQLRFRVACSGGTYIRVLAVDLAAKAGTAAHLSSLRRTGSSSFRVNNAITLEDCLKLPKGELPLLSVKTGLEHLPQVICDAAQAEKVRQGNLAAFDGLKSQIDKPGYFLLLEGEKPVAICNHHPMLIPFCSIERVFDPRVVAP